MKLLIIGLVGLAMACLFVNIFATRVLKELRAANSTLESCRVLLRHIAENMQRGEPVDLLHLAMREGLKQALGKQE